MRASLDLESTLTDRYQTTVPEMIRRALKLSKRDKIHYTIRRNGEVLLTRATNTQNEDAMLQPFLGFLAEDIAKHPQQLAAMSSNLKQRLTSLIAGVEVDMNAPLIDSNE